VIEYETSYFIMLPTHTKKLCYHSFIFIPFLRNNFIMHNASSQMSRRIVNAPHNIQAVLSYAFCSDVMKDREAPFSLNYVDLKN